MQDLTQADGDGSRGEEIDTLRKEINEMLDDEEIKWNQRSRVQWLTLGDRNTKYFCHKASQRKRKNEIRGLLDGEGNWCEDKKDIVNIIASYFKELFSTSFPTRVMEVAELILRRIIGEMNEDLTKEFQIKKRRLFKPPDKCIQQKCQALMVCLLSFSKSIGILLGKM